MSANFTVEEINTELKFHFMLHADKKSKDKWKDFELPFPLEDKKPIDKSGVTGLPDDLQKYVYKEER
jgi:hypothetical protein